MYTENDTLVIDEEMGDETIETFLREAKKPEIEVIRVENGNIAASIVQMLWCLSPNKKIEIEDPFLARCFEQVAIA